MSIYPLQKYARYVKHVSFNTYLLNLLQSPNFNVKNMCVMQNICYLQFSFEFQFFGPFILFLTFLEIRAL